jgi:hypothetical protein
MGVSVQQISLAAAATRSLSVEIMPGTKLRPEAAARTQWRPRRRATPGTPCREVWLRVSHGRENERLRFYGLRAQAKRCAYQLLHEFGVNNAPMALCFYSEERDCYGDGNAAGIALGNLKGG